MGVLESGGGEKRTAWISIQDSELLSPLDTGTAHDKKPMLPNCSVPLIQMGYFIGADSLQNKRSMLREVNKELQKL